MTFLFFFVIILLAWPYLLYISYAEYLQIMIIDENCFKHKIIWKNGSFGNRENLQYKKTADSVLLRLFMRTNGKCNNSDTPSTGLSGIVFHQNPIFPKAQKKNQHYIDAWVEVLPTPYRNNDSCCYL